jgi:hypothetical protein
MISAVWCELGFQVIFGVTNTAAMAHVKLPPMEHRCTADVAIGKWDARSWH